MEYKYSRCPENGSKIQLNVSETTETTHTEIFKIQYKETFTIFYRLFDIQLSEKYKYIPWRGFLSNRKVN